jgi:DNA-binding NarL/FixJ family response regulator
MSITALAPRAATPGGRMADLSQREREVLSLMSIGRSNVGIASDLLVSEGAVEKHVANIFMKLGLPPARGVHRRVLAVIAYLSERPAPPVTSS